MTKRRDPLTPYRALCDVEELLGWDGIAGVTRKAISYLRKLSDPDAGRAITVQDAIRLDAAFLRAGGIGTPFLEAHTAQIELLVTEADPVPVSPLLSAISIAAKEIGEAVAAAIDLASHAEDPKARQTAVKEAEEGVAAMLALLTTIKRGGRA